MKVTIDKNELYLDPEIIVKCKEVDGVIQDIISYIGIADKNMIGEIDGEMFFIPLNSVFYFESVDRNIFFYTENETYESTAKLYKIEENLKNLQFARISKTMIANLDKMLSIKKSENSRLVATLVNKEKLVVSRQYVSEIKKKLGV